MSKEKYSKKSLLPFSVIATASRGDTEAINKVLNYYAPYIVILSTRELFDEYGTPHICVDEHLRRRLEAKLISKIMYFDIA